MNLTTPFINPQTGLARSGWRALIFIALTPQMLLPLITRSTGSTSDGVFEVSFGLILVQAAFIAWVVLISWLCLRFLESLSLDSLGFTLHQGWAREVGWGCAISALMIFAVVGLQALSGGTRVALNPAWQASAGTLVIEAIASLIFLILAAAFEELVYRGYPFQTLLRGAPAILPILLFAALFGMGHWENPSWTAFSTINTVLAGVWLAIAYLKTRSLWFPTALHFTWNWMMGALFGLPVSGLTIPRHPILVSTSENPVWLTGGSYGPEGGAAATIVVVIATIAISRAKEKQT